MGKIVGIDLGTTTSEIAYIKDGKPVIIPNGRGERITPSAIYLSEEDGVIVGEIAKRSAVAAPDRTILEVKRLMGEDISLKIGNKEITPIEASGIILKELKSCAEKMLGEEVTEAVITVPANFNNLQRQATKEAGELAGFKVERIINEPTAAAIAYGIEHLNEEAKVLVYDLGGGTFDVTVLELFNGILEVKSSRGNNELGGKDFDERLVSYIIENFKEDGGMDLKENLEAMVRIKEVAEIAKINLSTLSSTDINLPYIGTDSEGKAKSIKLKITQNKFTELISDLVESTKVEVNEALKAANYKKEEIDIVLAVGGSTRVPIIKELLKEEFGDKVKNGINPDEAVALGAAIQAGIKNDEISSKNSLVVTDVCTNTLGIEILGSEHEKEIGLVFSPIIYKDTVIPCTREEYYETSQDYQTELEVSVYQGDNYYVKNNTMIEQFSVKGIPENLKGEEKIKVAFSYNVNGILEVEVMIISTGEKISRIIDLYRGENSKLIKKNIDEIITENYDEEAWKDSPLSNEVGHIIKMAEKKLKNISGKEQNVLKNLIRELKNAVIREDRKAMEKLDDEITDILFEMD